jgi:hypothetical protein
MAAAELRQIQLDDAVEILVLMAQERDPRFDRATARWVGRLLAERPLGRALGAGVGGASAVGQRVAESARAAALALKHRGTEPQLAPGRLGPPC